MVAEHTVQTKLTLPLAYDDLARFPADGNRYELIEGSLHVSPSPVPRHQHCIAQLICLLAPNLRADQLLFPAPADVIFSGGTVLEPDIVVAPRSSITVRAIEGPVDLVVEVLSPSTRRYDQVMKRATYAAHGVAEYWIVDPDAPSLTVLRLDGDDYRQHAHVVGDARFRHDWLDIEFAPRDLVAGFDA